MPILLHQSIIGQATRAPEAPALFHKKEELDYATLAEAVTSTANGLLALGLQAGERVAVYLPKMPQTVAAMFGASAAGGVFVPVNPQLKPAQVGYILRDCDVRVLVTSPDRAAQLAETLSSCPDLRAVVLSHGGAGRLADFPLPLHPWESLAAAPTAAPHRRIDADIAAILYTSGSTGRPKGVVLSHRNMLAGAESVAGYLENRADDRLLAVLPFSFDYGLSQLTTAFHVGASVVLMDYLLPRDVIRAVARHRVTGLAAVPPLWNQLADLDWPEEARGLRYLTNSGGAMPIATTRKLRAALPDTRIYLMYGLTEAFRSRYLPPEEIDRRPDSMGKAIPNAELMVVRPDGSECAPNEPGELVHRGALVALGYWNDAAKTAERFRPAPGQPDGLPLPEIAVWSGDQVRRDDDGYLYFIGRTDEMIKTSGYRVSPSEVEEVLYASGLVAEAVAIGLPHPRIGQGILVVCSADQPDEEGLLLHCKRELPNFMVPHAVRYLDDLPRNPNGKIDRKTLAEQHQDLFQDAS